MVVGAFPIAKLGTLLLKQISKPIANALKTQAKNSPTFSKYVCMPPAQFYNWCEVKAKMWVLNLGKPISIPVLNEAMAIELGANLLGEAIIFIVAAAALIFEYNRSARKDAAKEAARIEEIEIINRNLRELFFKTEEQGAQIKELLRIVGELEVGVVKKPWVPKKKSDDADKTPPRSNSATPAGFIPIPIHPLKENEAHQPKVESADTLKSLSLTPNQVQNLKSPYLNYPDEVKNDDSKIQNGTRNEDKTKNKDKQFSSFLLEAVRSVESELFNNDNGQKGDGIILDALNYLYKEVYRLPLSS